MHTRNNKEFGAHDIMILRFPRFLESREGLFSLEFYLNGVEGFTAFCVVFRFPLDPYTEKMGSQGRPEPWRYI